MRSSTFAVLTVSVCLHAAAPSAAAQECTATGGVTGVVRSEDGSVIPRVEVSVPGVASVMSDTAGRFRIVRACAGAAMLTARRLGFEATTWPITIPAGSELRLDVTLVPVALDLEPVVVRASESPSAVRLREFYVRRQRSPGHFLTREDLERHDDAPLTDALRAQVPGLRVAASSGTIRNRVRLRGQRCAPLVWLDGMPTPAGEFDLEVLQTSTIAAVEVYASAATIPVQFRTPFGRDGCGGVIVVWTRVGPDQWDRPRDERARQVASAGPPLPIFTADEVDSPARIDSTAMQAPIYPDSLLAFEVEGSATVEFVVDTTGLPLAGTAQIISATAPAFGDAVLRAIRVSRFIPARREDRAVRQRMQLPFRFTNDRKS